MGEHAVVYGYPCIITAVNQVITVEASIIDGKKDKIIAPQVSKTDFIDELIRRLKKQYQIDKAIQIKTFSEFSDKTGLGSSSASTVASCKALNEIFQLRLSEKDIFEISFQTVLAVQGSGSGADIASAVYEGTIYYKNKGEAINPLNVDGMHVIIGNTGQKAPTKEYIEKVAQLKKEKPQEIENIFKDISQLVEKGLTCIMQKDYTSLGDLMNENHGLLQQLEISSPQLDSLVNAANNAGALGAKLSGAGGGDNMFALVESNMIEPVQKAIEQAGGTIINAEVDYKNSKSI
jgi:mevalonate kinase